MNPENNSVEQPQHNSHHGFFLIIPAFIADDRDLDDATKMLFGRLSALSNNYGYCWASDKYLAELCNCGDRVITDRLKKLSDKNYIKIESKKEGMIWHRKIYPQFNISKNVYEGRSHAPRKAQPCPIEGSTRALEQDNCINNKTTTAASPPAAAVPVEKETKLYDCLLGIDIPAHEKFQIQKAYPENIVQNAVKFATHPDVKINTTLVQTLKWACKNNPEIPKTSMDVYVENKKIAQEIISKCKKDGRVRIDLLNDSVEIVFIGCMKDPTCLKYTEKGFKDQLTLTLKKLGLL